MSEEYDNTALEELKDEIAGLRDLFTRRLMEDKQKAELIRILGAGAQFAFIEPFLSDIILLMDRLEQSQDEFVKSVEEELFDILSRRGVSRIEVKPEFDPALYKAVRVTEDETVSTLQVTQVIRQGYTLSGKVIRPAEVVVARPVRAVQPAAENVTEREKEES